MLTEFTLYDRPNCPCSKRFCRVLFVLFIDYEEIIVPDEKDERDELASVTGQRGIPALVDDELPDGYIADSGDISAYLKDHYN